MPSAFDALLSTIISRATSEIAGAVRANMADEVLRAMKAHAPGAPACSPRTAASARASAGRCVELNPGQ